MAGLSDHLKETNKLLTALNLSKDKKIKKVEDRSRKKLSRVNGGPVHVRSLPIFLTRTVAISIVLIGVVIMLGAYQYFNDKQANAVVSGEGQKATSAFGVISNNEDSSVSDQQLLELLRK